MSVETNIKKRAMIEALELDQTLEIIRNGQEYVKTGEIQAHANT